MAKNVTATAKAAGKRATRLVDDLMDLMHVAGNPRGVLRYLERTLRHRPLMGIAAIAVAGGAILAKRYIDEAQRRNAEREPEPAPPPPTHSPRPSSRPSRPS